MKRPPVTVGMKRMKRSGASRTSEFVGVSGGRGVGVGAARMRLAYTLAAEDLHVAACVGGEVQLVGPQVGMLVEIIGEAQCVLQGRLGLRRALPEARAAAVCLGRQPFSHSFRGRVLRGAVTAEATRHVDAVAGQLERTGVIVAQQQPPLEQRFLR